MSVATELLRSHGIGSDYLLMLGSVYLDDSGTHQGSLCVSVGGYISTPQKWESFSRDWNYTIRRWGLDYFHLTDFEAGHGPYKGWPERFKKQRMALLYDIINEYVMASVANSIEPEVFEVVGAKARDSVRSVYASLVGGCVANASLASRDLRLTKLEFVIESGQKERGRASHVVEFIERFRERQHTYRDLPPNFITGVSVRSKKEFPPLQAADIVAYEHYRHLPVQLGRVDKKRRVYPWRRILEKPRYAHYTSLENAIEMNRLMSLSDEDFDREVGNTRGGA